MRNQCVRYFPFLDPREFRWLEHQSAFPLLFRGGHVVTGLHSRGSDDHSPFEHSTSLCTRTLDFTFANACSQASLHFPAHLPTQFPPEQALPWHRGLKPFASARLLALRQGRRLESTITTHRPTNSPESEIIISHVAVFHLAHVQELLCSNYHSVFDANCASRAALGTYLPFNRTGANGRVSPGQKFSPVDAQTRICPIFEIRHDGSFRTPDHHLTMRHFLGIYAQRHPCHLLLRTYRRCRLHAKLCQLQRLFLPTSLHILQKL